MKAALVVPIFDHGDTIGAVVEGLRKHALPILVVDDGSGERTRAILEELAEDVPELELLRHETNRGKGAALRTAFRRAAERGFTHVVHLDADGQHDPADVPRFLAALRERPDALVLGRPVFDDSVPRTRLAARQISRVLVWGATASFAIADPLVGFRGIPLAAALGVIDRDATGDRMEFEPEIAVRLVWDGVPVRNLATPIVYPEHGRSHFDFWREYPRLAALYARLLLGMPRHLAGIRASRRAGRRPNDRRSREPVR
ncbi:MAG: glycosyltransferase family 2 protein [Myxococcota bacterium]|nr:glycosyltransferase family 2 protein [Myxococcota bacterium]